MDVAQREDDASCYVRDKPERRIHVDLRSARTTRTALICASSLASKARNSSELVECSTAGAAGSDGATVSRIAIRVSTAVSTAVGLNASFSPTARAMDARHRNQTSISASTASGDASVPRPSDLPIRRRVVFGSDACPTAFTPRPRLRLRRRHRRRPCHPVPLSHSACRSRSIPPEPPEPRFRTRS